MDRPYQPLRLAIVAKQLTSALYPARNGAVADGAAIPDGGDQLVLADEAVAVLDQEKDQRKDLRLGGEHAVVVAQFELAQVQYVLAHTISHRRE
jgi:hypothetical protein